MRMGSVAASRWSQPKQMPTNRTWVRGPSMMSAVSGWQLLERDPGAQLNGSGDERLGRSSERRIGHVAVDAGQIDFVEHIFEIEAQLQAALLAEPLETGVLQHAGIHLNHPRIAATVAPQVSLRARRGGCEDTGRKQAGEVVLFAIGAAAVIGGRVRDVIVSTVGVIVAAGAIWCGGMHPERCAGLDRREDADFPPGG